MTDPPGAPGTLGAAPGIMYGMGMGTGTGTYGMAMPPAVDMAAREAAPWCVTGAPMDSTEAAPWGEPGKAWPEHSSGKWKGCKVDTASGHGVRQEAHE